MSRASMKSRLVGLSAGLFVAAALVGWGMSKGSSPRPQVGRNHDTARQSVARGTSSGLTGAVVPSGICGPHVDLAVAEARQDFPVFVPDAPLASQGNLVQ